MIGLVIVIVLALLLLYKVWVHHSEMELYEPDGRVVEIVNAGWTDHPGSGKNLPGSAAKSLSC